MVVGEHMKKALIRTKDTGQNLMDDSQTAPKEYASDQIKYAAQDAITSSENAVISCTKKAMNPIRHASGTGASAPPAQIAPRKHMHRLEYPSQYPETALKSRASNSAVLRGQTKKPKYIKTASRSPEKAIKTSAKSAQATKEAAIKSTKNSKKLLERMRQSVAAAAKNAKTAAIAASKAVKAMIAAMKELIATIIAGGWASVVVIVIILMIGLIVNSAYGIFFACEDTRTGMNMADAIRRINLDYQSEIQSIKASNPHDSAEISGTRAAWKDVLAVYAVKVVTDPDDPQEVVSMDEDKHLILHQIFWDMNEISYRTETGTETITEEITDEGGNLLIIENEITATVLYITVEHKTPEEIAIVYDFDAEQRALLTELLSPAYDDAWRAALYGIGTGDGEIVSVALSQLGTVGGELYWRYMGFSSRVEWCACFVSWCANECGYIDSGIIPNFSGCVTGSNWFIDRGQWMDGSGTPNPGDIIFFDWDDPDTNGQDGSADHVGIVEKVEGGYVYTIEGNSGDTVRENRFPVRYYEIYGYGIPAY